MVCVFAGVLPSCPSLCLAAVFTSHPLSLSFRFTFICHSHLLFLLRRSDCKRVMPVTACFIRHLLLFHWTFSSISTPTLPICVTGGNLAFAPLMMPPNPTNYLKPRAENAGNTFAIVFTIVAVFLVALCVLGGILSGKWGRKHTRPPSTRYNSRDTHRVAYNTTPPRFPSHPAVLRGFHSRPSREVQVYDPRTHTPFPNAPPKGDTIRLPSITLARSSTSLRGRDNYHTAFSPIATERSRTPVGHRYSLPKTPGTLTEMATYGAGLQDFVDEADSIITQSQPLVLEARSAGRAPPLSKQLDRFPLPRSKSGSSKELAHPNKLFEELERLGNPSETGGRIMSLPKSGYKPEPGFSCCGEDVCVGPIDGDVNSDTKKAVDPGLKDTLDTGHIAWTTYGLKDSQSEKFSRNVFVNKHPEISRSATVTEPRTPVTGIRDRYKLAVAEMTAIESKPNTLSKALTTRIEPHTRTTTEHSDRITSTTPPTSLPQNVTRLSLLPTPLRPRHRPQTPLGTPTPGARNRGMPLSCAALTRPPEKVTRLHKVLKSGRQNRRSIGFYHARPRCPSTEESTALTSIRNKSKRPSFGRSLAIQSSEKPKRRHSIGSTSSVVAPLMVNENIRGSYHASSIYSRDTKGMSIARSPVSPSFQKETTIKEEPHEDGTKFGKGISFDFIQSKIDNWDLHTGDFRLSSAPCFLERTSSESNPLKPGVSKQQSHTLGPLDEASKLGPTGLGISIPRIHIGRFSDDIFRDDSIWDKVSTRFLNETTKVGPEVDFSSVPGPGKAPGGAEWI